MSQAGWLDRQLDKAKGWTQFYKKNKGAYVQGPYIEPLDWSKGLSKRWIGVAEDHTVFLVHDQLFYAGGEGKSLESFEKVQHAPKIKDIIASGKSSYALGEAGELYHWNGIFSGELSSLEVLAQGQEDASSALWTPTPQGVLRVDNNVATLYNTTHGQTNGGAVKQMVLPSGIASIADNNGQSVFLMNSGFVVHGGAKAGAQFSSFWGDAVSLESTDDAVWVLTESGSVWRVDESGSSPVRLDAPLKEISTGSGHVLGLDASGQVWSWGKNTHGQLGSASLDDSSTPIQIEGLDDVIAIAAGYEQSFAVSSKAGLSAWGNNASGQLGIPNAGKMQLSPHAVHIVGVESLSKTSSEKAPVCIYFPQTGAIIGASSPH